MCPFVIKSETKNPSCGTNVLMDFVMDWGNNEEDLKIELALKEALDSIDNFCVKDTPDDGKQLVKSETRHHNQWSKPTPYRKRQMKKKAILKMMNKPYKMVYQKSMEYVVLQHTYKRRVFSFQDPTNFFRRPSYDSVCCAPRFVAALFNSCNLNDLQRLVDRVFETDCVYHVVDGTQEQHFIGKTFYLDHFLMRNTCFPDAILVDENNSIAEDGVIQRLTFKGTCVAPIDSAKWKFQLNEKMKETLTAEGGLFGRQSIAAVELVSSVEFKYYFNEKRNKFRAVVMTRTGFQLKVVNDQYSDIDQQEPDPLPLEDVTVQTLD